MAEVDGEGTGSSTARTVALNVLLAILSVVSAKAGMTFSGVAGSVSLVWPPAGLALAALVLFGLRLTPGVVVGTYASAALLGAPVPAALLNALGTTTASVFATLALRQARFRPALDGVSHVVAFVLVGALAASVLSATIGTTGLVAAGRIPPTAWIDVSWKWWLGDATGILVIGAAALTTLSTRRWTIDAARLLEIGLTAIAILLLGVLITAVRQDTMWVDYPLAYLFFPFLIRAAFRFGPAGAAGASLLIACSCVYAAAHGAGPFAGDSVEQGLVLLSLFVAVVSVTGMFVAAVIAERARADADRRRHASILEATTDFVGIFDADGRLTFVNRAGRRMVGLDEDADPAGIRITDLHPADAAEQVRSVGLPAAMRSGIWAGETTLLHRNGHEIPVSQVILAHRDDDDHVHYLSTIARDLSDRIRLEEQLLHAQKMEAVGRLAGGIAHDFNNLLTVIGGQSRLLLDTLRRDTAARAGVEGVIEAADRAATLTRQLLAFARRQPVEPRVIDVNAHVGRMEQMLRRLIGEHITLVTRTASDVRPVRIDPGQFEQLLVNLAVNARDAMPEGGRIVVETANVVEHEGNGGLQVRVTVIDDGAGMDERTLPLIFEPFFTTKGPEGGTGLGLATCYGIVAQAGGTITVESRPAHGSRFDVLLPAAAGETEEHVVVTETPPPRGRGTVLVVEDEPAVRDLTRRILVQRGYDVIVAADGVDGLAIARGTPALDLVVTDLVMPRMNGPELVERMRADGNDVKVLFMSGYAGDASPPAGAPFLAKPFTPTQLAALVHSLVHD